MPVKIAFKQPALLVGGARLDPIHDQQAIRERLQQGFALIAADGGANQLAEWGLVPDLIVGDMDSLHPGLQWQGGTPRLVHLEEQDTTDFEKCLYTVQAPWYLAFGFLGQRMDHSLAALHVLVRYVESHRVLLVGADDLVFVSDRGLALHLPVGERFSIFPLQEVRFFCSKGLRFPLDGVRLRMGESIGTSNCVIDSNVVLQLEPSSSGSYASMTARSQLQPVIDAICR